MDFGESEKHADEKQTMPAMYPWIEKVIAHRRLNPGPHQEGRRGTNHADLQTLHERGLWSGVVLF